MHLLVFLEFGDDAIIGEKARQEKYHASSRRIASTTELACCLNGPLKVKRLFLLQIALKLKPCRSCANGRNQTLACDREPDPC